MNNKELGIQKDVIKFLEQHELFPFSVIFTFCIPPGDGTLGITFFIEKDLNDFLDLIDYNYQCDKSGYFVIKETNSVILSSLGLINLYTRLI